MLDELDMSRLIRQIGDHRHFLTSRIISILRTENNMKVALIGATGMIGSRLLAELSRRGHEVTAIVRHPEKVPALPKVQPHKGDVLDEKGLAALLKGHDATISAVRFAQSDPAKLIGAAKASGVKRYLAVGGAGSLEVAPGKKLFDTPE